MPPNLAQSSLNSLTVGVLVLDGDDHPVLANPAAREMGLIRSSSDAHAIVRTLAGQTRRSGVTRVIELDIPRANTDAEPLGVHVRAVDIGGGYVAVEAADVTEAHRVARVRRDFVANVSHELKTPVGALQLLSEALQDAHRRRRPRSHGGGDPVRRPDPARVGPAQPAGQRVAGAVAAAGRRSAAGARAVRGRPDHRRGDRPQPDGGHRQGHRGESARRARPDRVRQREPARHGRGNLVENAVAYSPEDTAVEVSPLGRADGVEIASRDQGIGIEPRDLDRIFERFYRADRARSRPTGGTGLGLAIVKHIATNHRRPGRRDEYRRRGFDVHLTVTFPFT